MYRVRGFFLRSLTVPFYWREASKSPIRPLKFEFNITFYSPLFDIHVHNGLRDADIYKSRLCVSNSRIRYITSINNYCGVQQLL